MDNFYSANIEQYRYIYDQYESSDQYAERILQEAQSIKRGLETDRDDFLLITTILWEPHIFKNLAIYEKLFASFSKKKIRTILIINSWYKGLDLTSLNTKVYYVDYMIWRTYDKVVRQNKSKVNTTWNSDATKFLILNGKPGRVHRVRLLWKLKHLLKDAIWSLHVHEGTKEECKVLLPELSEKEFDTFIKIYNRNPDDAQIIFQENSLHYGGIPYDEKMFKNSLFRIITETYFSVRKGWSPYLTEKTFITILNSLPFIMAGDNHSLHKLKALGFRTFENYLPISDYDQISNEEKKLDAIVTNCNSWITGIGNKEQIRQDVEYNYNNLVNVALQNKKMLENICKEHGIDPTRINDVCTTYDALGNQ